MKGRFLKAAIGAIVAFGAAVTAAPARAERLIVSVSNHRITVTPNYSGEELVLFGSIERDSKSRDKAEYDIVVRLGRGKGPKPLVR